ncbi:MAG: diguanylate cyclase [Acidobacteria bacterium]|nr:diguanylate cyclase [Acidobacteriota bacterium]MBI3488585.1 diguanylate cyclase [Acidobacteriota bacterium]
MSSPEKAFTVLSGEGKTESPEGSAAAWMEAAGLKADTGLEINTSGLTHSQLVEANESLVIATVAAQSMTDAADEAVAKLAFHAEHDFLTGLPNRALLSDRLTQAIELAKRQGKTVALMYVDLDHFKAINDSLGHAVGDSLLRQVSRRLQACVRHSDTVSRQGGDEFLVLLPVVETLDDAAHIALKLIDAMALPFVIDGHRILATLSIGISHFPHDGEDVDALLRNADTAMYQAKERGRNNCQVFAAGMMMRPTQLVSPDAPPASSDSLRGANGEHPRRRETDRLGPSPSSLTLPEREAAVLANERTTNLREEAADLRADAATLQERALRFQELSMDLREDSADLRENAVSLRERNMRPKEAAARVETDLNTSIQVQLKEANEHLVLAAVEAQTMKEAAEKAAIQIARMAKLDAELQEIQKQETLGVLAAGVAHDFNNLLTAVISSANMGNLVVQSAGDPSPHFRAIEKAAMRAADLSRQLLAYAGQGPLTTSEVDLGIVIKEVVLLLQVTLPRQVTLHYDLAERLPLVKGDATQLFQVLMNLITNAGEASLPDVPGSITIRTCAEPVDDATTHSGFWILPVVPGLYATLEVKDAGVGMTIETMTRIFDPFFTTKHTGHGLGLAAVIGIIRTHGGGIQVESAPGRGSSFKLFLPALPEPATGAAKECLSPIQKPTPLRST